MFKFRVFLGTFTLSQILWKIIQLYKNYTKIIQKNEDFSIVATNIYFSVIKGNPKFF